MGILIIFRVYNHSLLHFNWLMKWLLIFLLQFVRTYLGKTAHEVTPFRIGSAKDLTCTSDIPHPITVGKLAIKQLEASDSGIYTCRATNMMGVTEYKIQVTVQRRFLLFLLLAVYEKSRKYAGVTRSENIYQNWFLISMIKITVCDFGKKRSSNTYSHYIL